MAAIIAGFYALGTGVTNLGAFSEATTYTRGTVTLTGTALSGLTQAVSQITGPTGPTGGTIYKGAIYDTLTGGNLLMYWDWTVLTIIPANFLAVTVNINFNSYVAQALNLSLLGGSGASGSMVDAGAQIGTINGQPLIAAQKLQFQSGSLVLAGTSKVEESAGASRLWQNQGLNIMSLDTSGNLSLLGTASTLATTGKLTITSGGTDLLINVGGVAVASIGTAGNLVLKGTVTASTTPT